MRTRSIVVSVVVLACLTTVAGRAQRTMPEGFIREGVPRMPNPPGPAPTRDLAGVWVGPQDRELDPLPPMTPAGEALFELRKPYGPVSSRGRMIVGSAPDRIIIAGEQQRVWREIWMDGRALPEAVDVRGAPESRYYGHSVGHWEGDHTLVIDTTGLDERPWLDEGGHPRSSSARIQERYTRLDEYNLQLAVTIDDPKFYAEPWTWMRANFYWVQGQEFEETFCIPSEGIAYRDSLARPSGIGAGLP